MTENLQRYFLFISLYSMFMVLFLMTSISAIYLCGLLHASYISKILPAFAILMLALGIAYLLFKQRLNITLLTIVLFAVEASALYRLGIADSLKRMTFHSFRYMSGECESESAPIAAPFIFCGGYAGLDSQFGTDIFHYMRVADSEQSQAITDYTKKVVNGAEEVPSHSRLENLLRVTSSANIKYKILDLGSGYYAITYNER